MHTHTHTRDFWGPRVYLCLRWYGGTSNNTIITNNTITNTNTHTATHPNPNAHTNTPGTAGLLMCAVVWWYLVARGPDKCLYMVPPSDTDTHTNTNTNINAKTMYTHLSTSMSMSMSKK